MVVDASRDAADVYKANLGAAGSVGVIVTVVPVAEALADIVTELELTMAAITVEAGIPVPVIGIPGANPTTLDTDERVGEPLVVLAVKVDVARRTCWPLNACCLKLVAAAVVIAMLDPLKIVDVIGQLTMA